MTTTEVKQLRALNLAAKDKLRTGAMPERAWLTSNLRLVRRLSHTLSLEKDTMYQTIILEALRRFADLADRLGDYDESRALLEPHVKWIREQVNKKDSRDYDMRAELLWFVLIYSVTEHRSTHFKEALDGVQHLERELEDLKSHIPSEKYVLLCHRIAFALGRHYQALDGYAKESEHCFTRSLECCLEYCISFKDDPKQKAYASYRMSVTMIGLARLFIDRGELERGLRELSVVKLLLTASPDKVTSAYVDLSLGQIHRQLDHLDKAIPLLQSALAEFKKKAHFRHYLFCRHELAKAHLNDNNFGKAREILHPPEPSEFDLEVEDKAELRWKINDRILEARIELEQYRNGAKRSHDGKLDRAPLTAAHQKVVDGLKALKGFGAGDVRARGLIVKASIDILLENYVGVETALRPVTQGELGSLDPTDVGWAWLVIAEARIQQHQFGGALEALQEFGALPQQVQNIFFRRKAGELTEEIRRLAQGMFLLPGERLKRWEEYETQLRMWIVGQCRSRGLSLTQQHEQLGPSKPTLRLWRAEYDARIGETDDKLVD